MQYVITHSIIWINCHKFIYVWSKLWFLPNLRTLVPANIKRTIVNISILLRLLDLHHVNTKVQASFIHSCLRILKDKELLLKISQVNKDGKNCKINYDHHVLINLPGDGVFFKVHLTIKTNYNYTQVCVWNISWTITDSVQI